MKTFVITIPETFAGDLMALDLYRQINRAFSEYENVVIDWQHKIVVGSTYHYFLELLRLNYGASYRDKLAYVNVSEAAKTTMQMIAKGLGK